MRLLLRGGCCLSVDVPVGRLSDDIPDGRTVRPSVGGRLGKRPFGCVCCFGAGPDNVPGVPILLPLLLVGGREGKVVCCGGGG